MAKKVANKVKVTEDLTIQNVEKLRKTFLKALKKNSEIEVVLSSCNKIDISGLQLLISIKNDKSVEVLYTGSFNESFLEDINKIVFHPTILMDGDHLQEYIKEAI